MCSVATFFISANFLFIQTVSVLLRTKKNLSEEFEGVYQEYCHYCTR